jgi:hypothetical protein
METFYTKAGDIETSIEFYIPSSSRVEAWWCEFKLTDGLEKYSTYFIGNFAEKVFGNSKLSTGDVDVVLVGDINGDFSGLKHILDEAMRIGFENELLIDVFYNNELLNLADPQPLLMYRSYKHWYRRFADGSEQTYVNEYAVEIEGGLFSIIKEETPNSCLKAKDRYNNGDYIGVQVNSNDAFDVNGKLKGNVITDIKKE